MSEEPIDGFHRVAAFLLSLDAKASTAILKTMPDDVVERVASAMANLDPRLSQPGQLDQLYNDLARTIHGPAKILAPNADELERLLAESIGVERGSMVLQRIHDRRLQESPFLEIEAFDAAPIALALKSESAAVTAVVLAHLEPSFSASILAQFDKEDALQIVARIATLEPPPTHVLRALSMDLAQAVEELAEGGGVQDPSERIKAIAELLSFSAPDIESGAIEALSEDHPDMAQQLREQMFTWDNLSTLDKRSMQKILGTVDTKTLSIALKGASEAIEENILGNLSSRVREMVAEERDLVGAIPMSDVQSARDEILVSIRALIEAGEFRPSRPGEDLVS